MQQPFIENQMYPVVVNIVGKNFDGSNLEINDNIRDVLMNIRTTFSNTFPTKTEFPLKKDESTYLKIVTVIRPSCPIENNQNKFLPITKSFSHSMITVSPIETQKLLSGKNFIDGKMCSKDFITTTTTIECIFQLANHKQHQVLILPPFGHNEHDNNPIDDIIKIYNYCIYKYGQYFKKIIIAIPKYYPKEIFDKYNNEIIKPNKLILDIEKKYEKEALKKQVMQQQSMLSDIKIEQKQHEKQHEKENKQEFTQDQINLFMKMMPVMMQNQH